MELVYLWVEDYKNIKKQGFNFSPRFECTYDGKNLTRAPKEHLENFFGKNINVTAIVGENGSGKSRILETFTKTDLKVSFYNEDCNMPSLQDNFDVLLFNENINSYLYKNTSNINQQIFKRFTSEPNDIDELNYKINNLTISFLSQIGTINSDIYFSPTHIELIFSKVIKIEDIDKLNGLMIIYSDTWNDTIRRSTINISDLQIVKQIFEKKINDSIVSGNIKSYLLLKEFIFKINQRDNSVFKYFSHTREYGDTDNTESVFESVYHQFVKEHSDQNFDRIIQILQDSNKEVFDNEKIILDYQNNDLKDIEILLVNIHRGYFDIRFFIRKEADIFYFNDLSDGEQQLLLIFSKIYYPLRTIYKDSTKKVILLIDEPDTFLHPDWQRKFFANLYKFIENIDIFQKKEFHFIVTSHSPFILSDLPKENVIFLEKYKKNEDENQKEGNCKNVSKNVNINPFGANIHTLLSHGFFMKDGLMGEFAKEKINTVITYLNQKQLSEGEIKYCENIISIIGEPILQKTLQHQLNQKLNPDETELEKLEREQKEIQAKIDKFKSGNHEKN